MSASRPAVALLRRPLQNELKKHVLIAFGLSTAAALGYRAIVSEPRKKHYQEFYKNYDEQRHFQRMAEAGVFDSVTPNAEKSEWIVEYEKQVDEAIAALRK
ncbi:cytochrome c oxidase subunit 6C-1 [Brachionus plicatilis]|uniref:Cytochrome c oxidase subunit 6C-1 n=1 Tax=Brachionus plicatilis TaxID=10195 RepID=A0A3M7SC03_BRAPC|nr:cytochrome c oxidase subunit 6C-1 [Brachionus plicatilis]